MIDAQVERSRRLVEHLAVLSRRERLDLDALSASSAFKTGAILTASGRVPNAMSTLFLRFMQASVSLRLQDGGRAGICRPFSFVSRYARRRTSETHPNTPRKHSRETTYPMIPPCKEPTVSMAHTIPFRRPNAPKRSYRLPCSILNVTAADDADST